MNKIVNWLGQTMEFKRDGMLFDGKTIPEFIDTEKSLKARQREKVTLI